MCQYGEQGEVISYYRGIDTVTYHKKTGKPNKKRIENWGIEGEIGWEFYIGLAEKLASEIFDNYVTEVDNNFEVEELVENE
jgi:hypothetical protein